jgi:hypothetical protein
VEIKLHTPNKQCVKEEISGEIRKCFKVNENKYTSFQNFPKNKNYLTNNPPKLGLVDILKFTNVIHPSLEQRKNPHDYLFDAKNALTKCNALVW